MAEGVLNPEAVLAKIEEFRGNVSAIARDFGVWRSNLVQYISTKPELQAALDDIRQTVVDKAESNIFAAVEQGDLGSSKMVVSMLGKDRGWVTREEQTGKDGAPLVPPQIVFTPYDDADTGPANDIDAPEPEGEADDIGGS